MVTTISIIVLLIILSAFFSGSETALTAASQPLMHQLEQGGNKRASLVNRLLTKKERLIGSILLGNNLVNILATALATSLFFTIFGEVGVVYATIAMTFVVLIFAEILPKTYAFNAANRSALLIAPIINALVFVLSPITRSINFILRGIFKAFGADLNTDEALGSTAQLLRGAIALHEGEEEIVAHERAMLSSVLDLAEVEVGEIMIHRRDVAMIDLAKNPGSIVTEALESPYTRLPIWQDQPENIIGVLHAKALLREVWSPTVAVDQLNIKDIATDPWFIPETTTLLDQLQAFRDRREHIAMVVDEYGSFMGVVTLEDILEEIVGDISDEHDISVTGVHTQPDGSFVIRGDVTIRDLNRQFGWLLPDEEAATLAGLVLHESRRIPDVGQAFNFHDFRFEILRRKGHQITSVRVTPPSSSVGSIPGASSELSGT
ncbi:MAG: HlyC/CorC family transporter [Rhodospirillaceae bacterium]|jgi:Mg2+/Co2+ transporter CorB|nr:HlyC/CorC family transporter [Rhodospirillales bacterium]MBT3906367.1 HlyC/CorC family transporter [Rhodospirillaceae bacterium]MBT4703768.1 HlyC/CorC family transporter [Rhodospirillaceae bacterium]MBT5036373.1 HlyC/CorC family transporter [Rhodospirillaceae bacterium]MBT6222275.1 HlyC/CorC family transporter [Rhodospirillaceae bacterium]